MDSNATGSLTFLVHTQAPTYPFRSGLEPKLSGTISRSRLRCHRSGDVARLAALAAGLTCAAPAMGQSAAVSPATMPHVATVDERYQSYNVEMAEVIGGKFWKPYAQNSDITQNKRQAAGGTLSWGGAAQAGDNPDTFEARPPIDLTNARLRNLAAALGPAYVRVSGTWANTVYFHNSDAPAPANPPQGFKGILTRSQWRNVIGFARAANARLTTSFAISDGVRAAAGAWTPDQARKLLDYTKTIGGEIAAAKLFNEPTMPEYGGAPVGYSAADHARDFAAFRAFASQAAPTCASPVPHLSAKMDCYPSCWARGPRS